MGFSDLSLGLEVLQLVFRSFYRHVVSADLALGFRSFVEFEDLALGL